MQQIGTTFAVLLSGIHFESHKDHVSRTHSTKRPIGRRTNRICLHQVNHRIDIVIVLIINVSYAETTKALLSNKRLFDAS